MQQPTEEIETLIARFSKASIQSIDKLPQAGSERHYYRLHTTEGNFIATHGANIKENETFIYFSKHFAEKKLRTAEVLAVSDDKSIYIQKDFGNTSLLDKLEQ